MNPSNEITAPNPINPASGGTSPTKEAFYATPRFIRNQRVAGLALIAIGFIAALFSPLSSGGTMAIALPLIAAGGILIGSSLIQQVMGNAKGCQHGKVKRVVAGVFIMLGGPIGWIVGGILWHLSNKDNQRR